MFNNAKEPPPGWLLAASISDGLDAASMTGIPIESWLTLLDFLPGEKGSSVPTHARECSCDAMRTCRAFRLQLSLACPHSAVHFRRVARCVA